MVVPSPALDLLFTNNPSLVNHCEVIPGISDHEMVVADQEIKPVYNKRKPRKIFLYQKTDRQTFKLKVTEMANHSAETVNTRTVNENWELFKNGIHNLMKDIIPSKLATSRSNLPWMTTKLRRIIKKNCIRQPRNPKKIMTGRYTKNINHQAKKQ